MAAAQAWTSNSSVVGGVTQAASSAAAEAAASIFIRQKPDARIVFPSSLSLL
jgi:hypothetical protein